MRKAALVIIITISALLSRAQLTPAVTPLPFNTKESNEYGPAPYMNGLVFCSDRKAEALVHYADEKNEPLTDIYFTRPGKNSWDKPVKFSPSISSYFHEGPATFTANGKKIYFTRNIILNKKESHRDRNRLGIYAAELIDGEWMNILPFEHNSREYSTGHPSLTPDGAKMFFISDMPGGSGGTDIYVTVLENGRWRKPVNIGPAVNTPGNEMFPFIDANGNLYFSSTGHNSTGGLDIFISRNVHGEWQQAQRLPEPVNSGKDDFAYVCDASGSKGYFSSSRNGSDDIFEFLLPMPAFNACDSLIATNYCFEFFQEGEIPADGLPLAYEWDLGDGTKVRSLSADHCFKEPGTYDVRLNIIDTLTGEVFYNEASHRLEIGLPEQPLIISADTCKPGQAIRFEGSGKNLRSFDAASYYWDFGDSYLDTGKTVMHTFSHAGIYQVRLGVTSAVSTSGELKKACVYKQVVVTNEMKKEITGPNSAAHPPQTILSSSQPLEVVYKVEVTSSTDRIPLDNKIFDNLKESYTVQENYEVSKNTYSYTVGEEKTLAGAWPVYKDVKSKGYRNASVKTFSDDIVSLDQVGLLTKKEVNRKTVRINNALFDPGRHELTSEARSEMDKLYRIMAANPGIKVYIAAHTDNEGNEGHNLVLSEKRAKAIAEYLAGKGISTDRMETRGYGESIPIADNSTAEGRKLNRRVEIKISWR
jgi:outer membrane protein OmpA-like peptidoglycan-associated protein